MRILLVEDEKSLSAAICQVLKREHFTVDAAYTGPEGLDNALSGIYDAVILDVMLPGKDGFSILKELRESGVTTPVMMLTARGELEDRLRGLDGGADYYLPKPFQMAELLACLRTITRRRDTVPMADVGPGLGGADVDLHAGLFPVLLHYSRTDHAHYRRPADRLSVGRHYLRRRQRNRADLRLLQRRAGCGGAVPFSEGKQYHRGPV